MILSIIIINYNSKAVLQDCLNSISESGYNQGYEIFVIDNNSSESIQELEAIFPQVSFIYNQKNIGFAAANNVGIRKSSSQYLLLLNPDTIVNKNSFGPMINYLEAHIDVGVVGCKIFNKEGEIERSTHSFPTLLKEFVHANEFIKEFLSYESKPGRFVKKVFRLKALESYWGHDTIREVDHVTGACLMVKKEAVEKAGLLDEAFFLYNEEVEWSYRIKKAGYKSVFLPDSNIIHLFGYSTRQRVQKQTVNKLLIERYRGMFYYFQKHYGRTKLNMLRILVLQGFGFRWLFTYIKLLKSPKDKKEKLKQDLSIIRRIISVSRLNNFDWRTN